MEKKFEKHRKRRIRELRQREQKYRKLTFHTSYKMNYKQQENISS